MKFSRAPLVLTGMLVTGTAVGEEQVFSGVVDEVIDASVFGTDIEVGDTADILLTLDITGPNSQQNLYDFFDGVAGEIIRYQWPSFLGFSGGTIDVEVGEASFSCDFIDLADVFVANDFQSQSSPFFEQPTDWFIANGTDGIPGSGYPPVDCEDFRFGVVLATQSTNPLDGAFLQLPPDQSVWDIQRWVIQTPVLTPQPGGGILLTWETAIRGTVETIGETPEKILEDFIEGASEADLPAGLQNSVVSSLENALAKVRTGNPTAAKNILNALINKLEAQSGKKIDAAEASDAIDELKSLIDML